MPANELVGLLPGDVFVHRNVANVVAHSDLNALSVIQFAVDALKVEHIIVVGHSRCGGVTAALNNTRVGVVDNWLRHVQDVRNAHLEFLQACPRIARVDALVELNVLEQARNVCLSTVVEDAWVRGQTVVVHGWVYGLHNGLLQGPELHRRRTRTTWRRPTSARCSRCACATCPWHRTKSRAAMFPHQLDDPNAFAIAQAIVEGFDRHYQLFSATARAAQGRFEQADWQGQLDAQRDRIAFYDLRVDEAVERLHHEFDAAGAAERTRGSRSSCTPSAC